MPKSTLNLTQKLAQAEDKIRQLVNERKHEISNIFSHCNALVLAFALSKENHDDPILARFKDLGKQFKLPSRRTKSKTKSSSKIFKTTN